MRKILLLALLVCGGCSWFPYMTWKCERWCKPHKVKQVTKVTPAWYLCECQE